MSRRNKSNQNMPVPGVFTADAFTNPMFRLGFGTQAPLEATDYVLTRLTDQYPKLNAMYRSGGIVQAIIDAIPADMLREWIQFGGEIDLDKQDAFDKAVLQTATKARINEGLRWGRLYGGAVGLIMIKGQEKQLDKPLDVESILPDSYAGLWILDRWSGVFPTSLQLVTDITDPDFGLPEFYDIRSGELNEIVARVHHSRLVRFTGRELPYLERLAEMYWGESEIEPLYEDIVLYDSVMHNMGNLTFQANVDTLAIKNLEQLFALGSAEQQRRFWQMMQAQSVLKSNFGTRLIDQETQLHTQQYTFTGFNYVVDAVQMNLSSKTHIPVTKLFGRSPSGMDATGDSDMQNYYDFIDGLRESQLRPILERLVPVICMSCWGEVPDDLSIQFPPLWTPTATELAGIATAKSQAIIAAFQSSLLKQGTAQKELKKLADETGMFDSIEDDEIEANMDKTYADTQQMADPMAGLFGGNNDDRDDKTSPADKSAAEAEKMRQNGPESPRSTSDGGPGSGNFGHAGRPGEVGGSASKNSRADSIKAFEFTKKTDFEVPVMTGKAKVRGYVDKKNGIGYQVGVGSHGQEVYKAIELATGQSLTKGWIESPSLVKREAAESPFSSAKEREYLAKREGAKQTMGNNGKPRGYGSADFSDVQAEIKQGKTNSMSEWINPDGSIKPERLEVHKQVIDTFLKDKKVSAEPTLTFLGGGTASGKGSVFDAKEDDPEYFVIDPDKIQEHLPGYDAMAKKTTEAAAFYHEEASAIAKQLAKVGYSEGVNAVYDGTGDGSVGGVLRKLREAKEKGYKINAKYVTIGIEEALKRNLNRYLNAKKKYDAGESERPPRLVPEHYARDIHIKVSRIAPQVVKEFDTFELWDNDRGKGTPKKIATGGAGKGITPVKGEEAAVQAFLDKGKEKLSYEH